MTSAVFSADGSVLAVAAENVITLWDPDNNALVGVIAETLSVSDNFLTYFFLFYLCLRIEI
jgi:NET1-associated nuclear protein 1 (U3 small nucleolar RNA-associated protein 17)